MTAVALLPERLADTTLPVDTFRDAAPHLRRPFTPEAVKFKVQAGWPKDNPEHGLIVAYIDARLAVERLNLVCPDLWSDQYDQGHPGVMWCHLMVDGIVRHDVGEGQGKGLVSDAFKRAAVKFGVGVSLYAVPQQRLSVRDGALKPRKTERGMTVELTDAGLRRVRAHYAAWLKEHGIHKFGQPLDHGDVEDAQGDIETSASTAPATGPEVPTSNDTGRLSRETVDGLVTLIKEAGVSQVWVRMNLVDLGVENVPEKISKTVLAGLSREQAEGLHDRLTAMGTQA